MGVCVRRYIYIYIYIHTGCPKVVIRKDFCLTQDHTKVAPNEARTHSCRFPSLACLPLHHQRCPGWTETWRTVNNKIYFDIIFTSIFTHTISTLTIKFYCVRLYKSTKILSTQVLELLSITIYTILKSLPRASTNILAEVSLFKDSLKWISDVIFHQHVLVLNVILMI